MTSASSIIMDQTHGRADVLVGPDWLEEHLDDPQVRLVEVDVSATAYKQGHIPGAVLWNVYSDLKDSEYRLLDAAAMAGLLVGTGIGPHSTVVCYGYAPALAFWLMKLYRHADVRVLDCSRRAWTDDERPWTTDAPTPNPTTRYPLAAPNSGIRADYATVRAAIGRRSTAIVDVRSLAEFQGERFWPSGAPEPSGRAGHVPSAIHLPIDNVHDERGRFRSVDELRRQFGPIAGFAGRRRHHVLRHRRPSRHRLVRADLPARPPERSCLRRILGRVGSQRRGPRDHFCLQYRIVIHTRRDDLAWRL